MKEKIFDIHIVYGKSLFHRDLTATWLQEMQKIYPNLNGCLAPCKPFDYLYEPANHQIEKVVSQSRSWLHTLRVDPWRLEEAQKLIQNTSAKILYLHFFEEQIYPTHAHIKALVEQAGEKKMKVMLASGYLPFSHAAQIKPLIKEFPKVTFILTHGAQINICGIHMEEAFEIFQHHPNTYFETSGIYREDYIERAIDVLGSKRILFGSGSPFYDLRYEIKRIEYLNVKDDFKQHILWHNAISLLNL